MLRIRAVPPTGVKSRTNSRHSSLWALLLSVIVLFAFLVVNLFSVLVLILPTPPPVMSLSLHHAQAQDLYEEKRSHESLAEKREKTRVKLELECAAAWRGGHYG